MMRETIALVFVALGMPFLAFAGAKKIPLYDVSTPELTLESAKAFRFMTESKPRTYPQRVAIGYFQVRYKFKQGSQTEVVTLKFDDESYQALTDTLYEQLEGRLVAEGMEVVPKDEVIASTAYQAIEGGEDEIEDGVRARWPASGMKNLPTFSGGPRRPGQLAALNTELGTDAVVAAYVNIGLCNVEPSAKTEFRSGFYACLRGDLTRPGINMIFVGGNKGDVENPRPEWTARWYKETEFFVYNKKDDLVYDMALISDWAAGREVRGSFWSGKQLGASEQSFVGGTSEIYDDALAMGFAVWEKKHGEAREAAGVVRTVATPEPGPATAAAPVGPDAPGTHEVPPLPGTVSCYFGNTTSGDVVLRRAVDAEGGKIVEDSITFIPNQAPYRSWTTWTVDGNSATGVESEGKWTGTTTFEGEAWAWSSWKVALVMGNQMTVASTYTPRADGLSSTSEIARAGAVIATVEQDLPLVDEATCNEKFSMVAPPAP